MVFSSRGFASFVFVSALCATAPSVVAQDVQFDQATDTLQIQFDEVEGTPIKEFIKLAEQLTQHQFNYDDRDVAEVRIKMVGRKTIPTASFWSYFQAVLKSNDFVMVYYGPADGTNNFRAPGFFAIRKATNQAGAKPGYIKSQAPVVPVDKLEMFKNDPNIVLTTSFSLKYVPAQDAMNMLQTYFSDPLLESVRAVQQSNSLVITGYAQTLYGAKNLIELFDVKPNQYELKFAKIQLEFAVAEEIKPIVDQLIAAERGTASNRSGGVPQGAPSGLPTSLQEQEPHIEADPRTNALYVMAAPGTLDRIIGWIRTLDVDVDPRGDTHVYRLKNSSAKELEDILNEWAQNSTQGANGVGGGGAGAANQGGGAGGFNQGRSLEQPITVVADESSNSLIISASKSRYAQILEIVKKLDVRRRQVLVETALVEISGTLNDRLSVELGYGPDDGSAGLSGEIGVSSFGLSEIVDIDGDGIGDRRVPIALKPGTQATGSVGLNAGILDDRFGVPVILQALRGTTDANVLSVPSILVNDNENATLTSEDEVPTFTTSQGQNSDQTSFEDFQSAGITLSVSPSISAGNYLRMFVSLNVSTFTGTGNPPPRATREVETQVTLPDGHTMVIGGIVADDTRSSASRVPWLGELPWFGWLFSSTSDQSTRTNLYVFITPHIISDDFSTLDDLSYQKKKEMEALNGKIAIVDPDWDRDNADTRVLDAAVSGVFDLPSYASPPGGEQAPKKPKADPDAGYGEQK